MTNGVAVPVLGTLMEQVLADAMTHRGRDLEHAGRQTAYATAQVERCIELAPSSVPTANGHGAQNRYCAIRAYVSSVIRSSEVVFRDNQGREQLVGVPHCLIVTRDEVSDLQQARPAHGLQFHSRVEGQQIGHSIGGWRGAAEIVAYGCDILDLQAADSGALQP